MARPRRKLKWVKFWIDPLLDGTTRDELDPAQRGIFYDLILMAGRANAEEEDGWIIARRGSLPRLLNVDPDLLEAALLRCEEVGKIELNGDRVRVVNWERYNPSSSDIYRYDKEEPRNADQSEAPHIIGKLANATQLHRVEESRVEEIKSREEAEEIREEAENDDAAATATSEGTRSPELQRVVAEYEANIHPIHSPRLAEDIASYVEGPDAVPIQWWNKAIILACERNVRKWSYIKGIFENCKREGTVPGQPRSPPPGEGGRELTKDEREERYLGGEYGHLVTH